MAEFDAKPIPNIEEVINKMSGHKFFTKMDYCLDYRQIWLSKFFNHMTSFENSRGLFQFKIMPLSLVNSWGHVLQVNVTETGQWS